MGKVCARIAVAILLLVCFAGPRTAAAQEPDPSAQANPPLVLTDKTDYAPGETAHITGSGFGPNETVSLQAVHADDTDEPGSGHEPWTVATDSQGTFSTTWFVNPDDSADSLFRLTADSTSGHHAEAMFTDAVIVETIVINQTNTGWYEGAGFHSISNPNYIVGRSGTTLWRDFFVFNVPVFTGTVVSASIRAINPCSGGSPRTYTLYQVSTSISDLIANWTSRTDIYNDLGSGTSYGSVFVSNPASSPITVPLNSAGIAAIQSSSGVGLAFGGDYPGASTDFILGCSGGSPGTSTVQLILQLQRVITDTQLLVQPVSGTYGTTVVFEATLKDGTLGVGGKTITFRRNGTVVGTATTNAVGVATLNVSLTGINAGTYTTGVQASFGGDSSYAASSGSATLAIGQADPTVTVQGGVFGYDGNPHAATGSVTGVLNESLGTPVITYNGSTTVPIGAGHYIVVANYAGNVNYRSAMATTSLDIQAVEATISLSNLTHTFDGTPKSATATTSPGGLATSVTYDGSSTLPIIPGGYAVVAMITDANHTGTANGTLTIARASATVNVTGGTFTFDGQSHSATGSVTGVGSANLGTPTFTYNGSAQAPVSAGSYVVVASFAGDLNYEAASATTTLIINRAAATVNVAGGTFFYNGLPHAATGSVVGVAEADLGTPTFTYNGSAAAPVEAGSYAVVASFAGNGNYEPASNTATLLIKKAVPNLTVTGGTFTYDGNPHAATGSVTGANGANIGLLTFTYNGSPTAPVNAGSYAVAASFAGNDNYEAATDTSGTVVIHKATAAVNLTNLTQTYTSSPLAPSATTSPANLTLVWTGTPQTQTGSYTVTATVDDPNYEGSATGAFVIAKTQATVTLNNLSQTFTGGALSPTAMTSPTGLNLVWTGTPQTAAGSYPVTATIDDPNYEGSTSGTFVIGKAAATVTLSNLTQTYTGSPLTPAAATSPSGKTIVWTNAPQTNAGSYTVTATINDPNYEGSATGTFLITKATATVTLSNLMRTYTTGTLTPTAMTSPAGKTIVWTGAPQTNAGSYSVTATIDDPNYEGSATGTFVIGKATATVTLSNLAQTHTGSPLTPTATTSPALLAIVWTNAPQTNAGSHAVTATVDNANYQGSASGTFVIGKITPTLSWAAPGPILHGTPLSGTQLNATTTVPGTFTYAPPAGTVLAAGAQTLTATFTPADPLNYNGGSISTQIAVIHSWSNVLQPINTDDSSIFKLGSTVPVKFRLVDGSAPVTNLQAQIFVAKMSNSVVGDEVEAVSTSAADTGNTFRYDSSAGQYIFNLNTKSMSQGTWQIRIDLRDGQTHTVLISLRK